jgi:hypothetical protein
MTAAPVTATCTAQITDPTGTWACTNNHLGIYHVAATGDGGFRLWLDPDDCGFAPWEAPMIARIRAELGLLDPCAPAVAAVLDRVADLAHRMRGRPSTIREINAVIAAHDALTGGGA